MAKTKTEIRSLARSHTASAIKALAGIMNEKTVAPAARVSAANALLDRGWGKPAQPLTGEDGEGPAGITVNIVPQFGHAPSWRSPDRGCSTCIHPVFAGSAALSENRTICTVMPADPSPSSPVTGCAALPQPRSRTAFAADTLAAGGAFGCDMIPTSTFMAFTV